MTQYISKSALVAEIKRRYKLVDKYETNEFCAVASRDELVHLMNFIDTLEVKDPYEQYVQHDSIKSGIQAHAETYSFNIESVLFPLLTKEQQKLWRKEIEQACISGGEVGVELARDTRYKENVELKEVDLEQEYKEFVEEDHVYNKLVNGIVGKAIAKHFFELGQAQSDKELAEEEPIEYNPFDDFRHTDSEKLPTVSPRETLDEFSYQVAYDLSNDWMKENPTWEDVGIAVKLGAKWKEDQIKKVLKES